MSGRIRIATYNVENLFGARHRQRAKKARARRSLASMISKVDADVLALQEVGGRAELEDLNARLARPYPHLGLIEGNSHRGIHLAYLSRARFEMVTHRDVILEDAHGAPIVELADPAAAGASAPAPARFQRDLLLARLDGIEPPLAVFNVHLKSRNRYPWSIGDPDDLRLAEARAVRDIVSGYARRHPGHLVVLLGDCNQRLDHPSLQPLTALGFFDPVLAELVPVEADLTTFADTPGDRIDHILLEPRAAGRYVAGSATVYREAMARKASDHYPVSIELQR